MLISSDIIIIDNMLEFESNIKVAVQNFIYL